MSELADHVNTKYPIDAEIGYFVSWKGSGLASSCKGVR